MTVEAVLEAHSASRAQVVQRVTAILSAQWRSLGSWDREDISTFVERAVPAVSAGQALTATLVDVYLSQVLTEILSEPIPPVGLEPMENLRGVASAEVYARPFVDVWTALKNGEDFAAALARGQDRLTRLGEDDLDLAYRRAVLEATNRQPRITGYRRVIRPELSGVTCGLCVAASSNIYRRGTLMPIHTHCKCAVMPIVSGRDPGRVINGVDIDSLYKQAASNGRTAEELSKARFVVQDHGELGPMLMPEGQKFTKVAA